MKLFLIDCIFGIAMTLAGFAVGWKCNQHCEAVSKTPGPVKPTDDLEDQAWYGYYTCEFNVRYYDEVGGDKGLRGEWESLRSAYKIAYEIGCTQDSLDELYLRRFEIGKREITPPNPVKAREASQRLQAEADCKKWPPEYKPEEPECVTKPGVKKS